jgi:hypothetical protein
MVKGRAHSQLFPLGEIAHVKQMAVAKGCLGVEMCRTLLRLSFILRPRYEKVSLDASTALVQHLV